MNYYDFRDYPYFALIVAPDEETALIGYEEVVADIDEFDKVLSPRLVTSDIAKFLYLTANIEGCTTEEEKENDFNKSLDEFKSNFGQPHKYLVLLIDSSLC